MQFPKDKMKLVSSYQGREADNGWLVLDIKNVDIEGVAQIYVCLDDLEKLKKRSNQDKDLLDNLRNLLSEP